MASGSIDSARATQILLFAQSKCERIVTPLPASAIDIVVGIAARAFSNPEGILTETVGPFTVQRGPANLYLTRQERGDLRRLAGRSGAFSIETLSIGTSAMQLITITGAPTGGTFTLNFYGESTTPLAYNATPDQVQAALEALPVIQAGNILVTGTGPYTVTFQNDLATTPVPMIGGDGSALSGGTTPTVVVSVLVTGVYSPGQGLAPWDYDYSNSRRQTPLQGSL
jgi:hypothetical protein